MAERGIDITGEFPKPWTDEVVRAADVVVTMGCGDACPIFPGKRYLNWDLDDPAGQSLEAVRPIRDEIERRVRLRGLDGRTTAVGKDAYWIVRASTLHALSAVLICCRSSLKLQVAGRPRSTAVVDVGGWCTRGVPRRGFPCGVR